MRDTTRAAALVARTKRHRYLAGLDRRRADGRYQYTRERAHMARMLRLWRAIGTGPETLRRGPAPQTT